MFSEILGNVFSLFYSFVFPSVSLFCRRFSGILEASSLSAFSFWAFHSFVRFLFFGSAARGNSPLFMARWVCDNFSLWATVSCLLGHDWFQHSRWSGRSMLIFPNVKSREFWSGYISLYQASRILPPHVVALSLRSFEDFSGWPPGSLHIDIHKL